MRLVGVSVFLYVGLSIFYNLPTWHTSAIIREVVLWPVLIALIVTYVGMIRLLIRANSPIPLRAIVLAGVLVAAVAVSIPPFHSTDVFGYINRGWQQAQYHLNPYVFTVDKIPGWQHDPMITDHWVSNPSPYGFIYLHIAKTLCLLGGGNKLWTLWLFKVVNGLVHLLTAALLYACVKARLSGKSDCSENSTTEEITQNSVVSPALFTTTLYLFSPLILLHGLANGHNDLWMGLFVMLTAFCTLKKKLWIGVLPTLTVSILIKYGTVVLVPFALLFLWQQKAWKALLGGLLISAGIAGVSGLPYLPDWQQFNVTEIGRNAVVSHSSLHSFIMSTWKIVFGLLPIQLTDPEWDLRKEAVRTVLSKVLMGSFGLFYIGLLFKRFRQAVYTPEKWLEDALLLLVMLVTVISLKFYPWYLGLFFALALSFPVQHWLRRILLSMSVLQVLSFTVIGQAHILNFLLMTGIPWVIVGLPALGWSRRRISWTVGGIVLGLLLLAFGVGFMPVQAVGKR